MNFLRKTSLLTLATSLSLSILALFLFVSMLLGHLVGGPFIAGPAGFFINNLSWLAYALPVYIAVAAWLLLKKSMVPGTLFVYLGSLVPFAVLAFLVRFIENPNFWLQSRPGLALLGFSGVVALFAILLVSLAGLLVLLRVRLFPPASTSAFDKRSVENLSVEKPKWNVEAFNASAMARPNLSADSSSEYRGDGGFKLEDIPALPALAALAQADEHDIVDTAGAEVDGLHAAEGVAASKPLDTAVLVDDTVRQEGIDDTTDDTTNITDTDDTEDTDEPIPLIFHRELSKSKPESVQKVIVAHEEVSLDTEPSEGCDAVDPATSGEYWDNEALDVAALKPVAPLLAKVEVFADGTHQEALRQATEAGRVAEHLPVPEGSEKKNHVRLVKTGQDPKRTGQAFDIPVISVPPEYLVGKKHTPIAAYSIPTDELLTSYPDGQYWVVDEKTTRAAQVLKETLAEFNIEAEVTGIRKGPVITMFEILPAPGVRLSKIANLGDNIALRLAASSVRIVAPIPGKHAVGIEVPNEKRAIVSFKEIVETETFKSHRTGVPVVLGKDITGDVQVVDLTQTPHLLIAGATGSGKSVCVNSIILSILYRCSFNEVKLLLIDPKVVELKLYNGIPHLLTPVITEPKRAFQALQYCICEMERRYSLLDAMGVRDIRSYNRKIIDKNMVAEKLPYIVVIIDEFADLMATTGKELESTLARLAAMSRAVGIHLVLATQRPSVDVITGLIKANIPSRIAFMVAGKFDSRIIIDMVGAEKLLGKGDMLYSSATDAFPVHMQGAFVSDEEVERVVDYVKTLGEPDYIDEEIFIDEEDDDGPSLFDEEDDDPLYEKALEIVLSQGKASASYLQRKLKIGYNRAARLVELMEEKGIVGPMQGSKPRDVMRNPDYGGARAPSPKARYVPDFSNDEGAGAAEQKIVEADGELAG